MEGHSSKNDNDFEDNFLENAVYVKKLKVGLTQVGRNLKYIPKNIIFQHTL